MVYSPFRMPNLDPRLAALMPDPSKINMVAPAPKAPIKQPGLLARIGGGLLDRFMPAPSGGLLSDEDIKNARRQGLFQLGTGLLAAGGPSADQRGTLANLGAAMQGGRDAYQGAADHALARQGAAQQMQSQQQELAAQQGDTQRQAQLAQKRQEIIAAHPLPKDAGGMSAWIEAVLPKFMAAGDEEYVQRLSAIRSTLGNGQQQAKEPGQWVEYKDANGVLRSRYVTAGEAGQAGVPVYEKPQRDTDDAMTINSRFMNEQRLEDHYGKQTEGVQKTVDAYLGAVQASKMGGSGDLQILYSFIRALDPNSVVREGEVALARQSASLWSQAHILKNKFETEGGTLSPVQRQQMLELMKQMVELKAQRTRQALKSAQSRSERFGLNVYLHNPLEAYDAFLSQQGGDQPNEFGVVSGGSSTAGGSNYDQYRQGKPQ